MAFDSSISLNGYNIRVTSVQLAQLGIGNTGLHSTVVRGLNCSNLVPPIMVVIRLAENQHAVFVVLRAQLRLVDTEGIDNRFINDG
jgi:hypothetical protein